MQVVLLLYTKGSYNILLAIFMLTHSVLRDIISQYLAAHGIFVFFVLVVHKVSNLILRLWSYAFFDGSRM